MSVDNLVPVFDNLVGMEEKRGNQQNRENNDEDLNGVVTTWVFLVHVETWVNFADNRSNATTSKQKDEDYQSWN